ncbi:MAG: hypothetical protein JSR72_20215 [Proteobacteria bacterium]|nr:hypothetical protein [Pseudomonadota bacterium]
MTDKSERKYWGRTEAFAWHFDCTTDFMAWQEEVYLDCAGEIEHLHDAIEKGERVGKFKVEERGKNIFVLPSDGDVVLILTAKSRDAFLRSLKPLVEICDREMHADVDGRKEEELSLREKVARFKEFHSNYS